MPDITLPSSDGSASLTLEDFRVDPTGGAYFQLAVSSRGFTGRSPYALEPSELRSFISSLRRMYDTLTGTAEIRLHMEQEHVAFRVTVTGAVTVTGVLIQYDDPAQRLEFAFHSDQSCLPAFLNALSAA